MERWSWGLLWILLGLVGWPSPRVQATSLATVTWLLRLGLGLLVLAGAGLSFAPEWTQAFAPDALQLAGGLPDLWAAMPQGTRWLLIAVGVMALGLPIIAILDFARDVTLLHGARPRVRPLRETFVTRPPTTTPADDVATALDAFRRFPGPVPPRTPERRPLHEALRGS